MKILYLECNMGVAGDMLMAALFELTDNKQKVLDDINKIGFPNISIAFENKLSCGIVGTYAKVECAGVVECADIHKKHFHKTLSDVADIINNLNVSDTVKENALKVYNIIAEAESRVHNCTIDNIHFHEVGTLDAIADVVVCSYLIDLLNIEKVVVSPINTGFGTVKCAHGILPVPAPATAEILIGIPNYSDNTQGELCTPTGAALIKHFADEFSSKPLMLESKIGYGMGTKEYDKANCVRAFLGSSDDSVVELACNIDDMTAEQLGYACEVLMNNGALDVYQTPVVMKKTRLATMLSVICDTNDKEKFISLIFKHTSTLGIREYNLDRYTLKRKINKINTPFGSVSKKVSEGYGVTRQKLEYEDIKKIADVNNLSIDEVLNLID